jgi:hypothetical protein
MSSVEEKKRYERFLEAAKEVESYNKDQALRFLQEAGIADKSGKLAPMYR